MRILIIEDNPDLALPGMDGLEVCRKLRQEAGKNTPVLMLTARDRLEDKLAGFETGADDYLVKPFELQEVEVRLEVLATRGLRRASKEMQVGDLVFNLDTLIAARRDHEVITCRHRQAFWQQDDPDPPWYWLPSGGVRCGTSVGFAAGSYFHF